MSIIYNTNYPSYVRFELGLTTKNLNKNLKLKQKAKMTFLLVLHRKNKHFEGLFQNFKMTALFEIVVQTGI